MVPEGWLIKTIGEVADVKGGKRIPKGHQLTDENTGYPYIRVTDMIDGGVDMTSIKYVPADVAPKIARYRISKEDIFITVAGTLGLVGEVPVELDGANLTENADKLTNIKCNKRFLLEVLRSPIIQKPIDEEKTQNAQPKLALRRIKEFAIPYPPLPEQKKIAQILSTWDKAITTTEQLLHNSQQQKKSLMQQLLTGKKRLLNKSGVRFSGEWKFQSISQISKRIQRKSDGEDHPILTISSLSGFVRQDERYSRYMAGESVKNYILLKKGEFAYNKGNSKTYEFGCIFDLDSYKSGLVPHVYVCFKLHQGLSHRYFKYLFEADYLKPQLGALVNTGVRNNGLLNIKPAEFMNTKVPVPCLDEQEQIADVLHASSETINKLQLKLDALKQEKKALMQQLLTGKRRVLVS